MGLRTLLAVCLLVVIGKSLGSSDDRFIKKYAMMKIYESCFGPEVVKQIRQEMKAACAKCSAPPAESPTNVSPTVLFGKLPPGFAMDPNTQTITRPNDGGASGETQENESVADEAPQTLGGGKLSPSPFMDLRHQAPQPIPQQPPVGVPPYMFSPNGAAYRPYTAASPFYQYPYASPNMLYPGSFSYNPYPSPYQQPQSFYQNPYFASQRMSRDMDLRDKIEMITSKTGGKMRNITCVMQELGYLDHNLEPNYEQITSRISNLPVSNELKEDIQEGLQFCQKFAQCVPEVKKDSSPLSRELIRPMFFFRCYKHKKLESCIMKDIRERFTSEDDIETETDFRSISRQGKSMKYPDGLNDPQIDALDEMAVYMYDFLSGGNSFDFDLYM